MASQKLITKGHYQSSFGSSRHIVKKEKANWDLMTTETFCQVCAEEVHAGNRPHTHFNKIGWDNMVINFRRRSGRIYDYKQLKNRRETLKTQYKAWKKLLMEIGLGWDPDRNIVLADDSWWEEKIKVSIPF